MNPSRDSSRPLGVVSLFSGVGGMELGLERAGMRSVYQCEIDKHCQSILEHHWPGLPRWDDVSTLTAKEILSKVDRADVIAWGSPCQDLSVAGRRAGLAGSRSSLFHEGMRIIREMREETNGKYPRISIWENVAGALTSNKGADFGLVLDAMAEAGAMVCEWRLLDAQYFGIPQRRRRVFLVAVFDSDAAERSSNPILSLSEGLRRYPAPSSSQGQGSPGEVAASPRGEGSGVAYTKSKRPRSVEDDETWESGRPAPSEEQGVISFPTNFGSYAQATEEIAQSMAVKAGPPSIMQQENHARPVGQPVLGSEIVGPLSACDWKYPQNQQLAENKFIVAEEPVLMRQREGKAGGGKGPLLSHNKSLTLAVNNDQYLFQAEEDPILFENSYRDNVTVQDDGIFPTLTAKMGTGGNNTPMLAHEQPVAFSIREDAKANTFSATQLDRANALSALQPSPQSHHAQMFITDVAPESPPRMIVRRLMPIECERLMGWPDDWTRWRADGKEQADTHRYKQCGNGVASPCSEWIGGIIARLLGGSS